MPRCLPSYLTAPYNSFLLLSSNVVLPLTSIEPYKEGCPRVMGAESRFDREILSLFVPVNATSVLVLTSTSRQHQVSRVAIIYLMQQGGVAWRLSIPSPVPKGCEVVAADIEGGKRPFTPISTPTHQKQAQTMANLVLENSA